jgi:hypothetical protein
MIQGVSFLEITLSSFARALARARTRLRDPQLSALLDPRLPSSLRRTRRALTRYVDRWSSSSGGPRLSVRSGALRAAHRGRVSRFAIYAFRWREVVATSRHLARHHAETPTRSAFFVKKVSRCRGCGVERRGIENALVFSVLLRTMFLQNSTLSTPRHLFNGMIVTYQTLTRGVEEVSRRCREVSRGVERCREVLLWGSVLLMSHVCA